MAEAAPEVPEVVSEPVDREAAPEGDKAEAVADKDGGAPDESKDGAKGEANGEEGAEPGKKSKTLDQMMSLKEGDDERTQISKKVSWILRHGARKVDINIDVDGWVTFADLLGSPIMAGVTEEKLMDIVDESNQQKVRYELKDPEGDGGGEQAIKAVSKHTISGMSGTVAREQRRAEKEQRREERQQARHPDRDDAPDGQGQERPELPAGQQGSWNRGYDRRDDRPEEGGDGELSYEQQIQEGYRPVYQGHRIVAMVNEAGQAVKPGRQQKGDYKGDSKGYMKGYGKDAKGGYGDRGGYGGYGNYGGDYRDNWKGGKDSGKGGYRDQGGRNDYPRGDGGFGGKYGGKGYEDAYYEQRPRERIHSNPRELWRVCEGQEAIMRAGEAMESQAITTLTAGRLVYQTGQEVTNQHGIIRMPVETYEDPSLRGWVTRTAEAAHGPAFFRREPVDKGSRMARAGKGDKGKGGRGYDEGKGYDSGKGKGRSDYGQYYGGR